MTKYSERINAYEYILEEYSKGHHAPIHPEKFRELSILEIIASEQIIEKKSDSYMREFEKEDEYNVYMDRTKCFEIY